MRLYLYAFFGVCFIAFLLSLFAFEWIKEESYPTKIGHINIYDRHGAILTHKRLPGGYSRAYTGSLDAPLIRSILTIEDQRYYEHTGIDILAKIGSIRENYRSGEITRGGSTLTEQWVKNHYFPTHSRTYSQKVREAWYAIMWSLTSTKEEMLRKYLDSVYMGNGIYGIQAALDIYFQSKDIESLSHEEIIEILTRIHTPNLGNSALSYAQKISERLYGGNIDIGGFPDRQGNKNIDLFPHLTERILSERNKYCTGKKNILHMFVTSIPQQLCASEDIDLFTTIDRDLSQHSRDTLEGTIHTLEKENIHNGALYILNPRNNTILTYIGNRSVSSRENAIDMIPVRRSVGSILKPFLYSIILADGHDGESLILDDTQIYKTESGKDYVPENYIPKSYGPIRIKEALGNSLNSSAVRFAEHIGISRVYDAYRRAGLELDHDAGYYGYSIALGGPELSLENIVTSYKNLLDLKSGELFLLYDILSNNRNRSMTFGYSSILNTSIPLAVKTGTSTDFYDNWAIGYHEDAIIGVWVGNADHTPMQDVSGVSGAGPIYHKIAEYMIKHGMIQNHALITPKGIVNTSICLDQSCMRKENVMRWEHGTNLSRIGDQKYYLSEFVSTLSDLEKQKWNIEE